MNRLVNFFDTMAGIVRGHVGHLYTESDLIEINCFSQFVRGVSLEYGDLRIFRKIRDNGFHSLNEIELFGRLTHIECVVNVLPNVETLKFIQCEFDSDVD